jgi:hypothetical protein
MAEKNPPLAYLVFADMLMKEPVRKALKHPISTLGFSSGELFRLFKAIQGVQ